MVVEDVNNPETKVTIDPKAEKGKEEGSDAKFWEDKAKTAQAKREYEEETARAEAARRTAAAPPETPFKIHGEVNLGTIDLQAQAKELKDTIGQIQEDAQSKIGDLEKANADYRDRVHEIQIQMMETTVKAQLDAMGKALNESLSKKEEKSIISEIDEVVKIASVLGYSKGSEDKGTDPQIKIAIMKMEMENSAATRKFEWDKIQSERNWQLELKKLEQQGQVDAAKFQQEREKRSMFASPFEALGMAIAKGLMDSNGGASTKINVARGKRSSKALQAGESDSGQVPCPECDEPVAIAPNTKSAVCASCEAVIPIKRIPDAR